MLCLRVGLTKFKNSFRYSNNDYKSTIKGIFAVLTLLVALLTALLLLRNIQDFRKTNFYEQERARIQHNRQVDIDLADIQSKLVGYPITGGDTDPCRNYECFRKISTSIYTPPRRSELLKKYVTLSSLRLGETPKPVLSPWDIVWGTGANALDDLALPSKLEYVDLTGVGADGETFDHMDIYVSIMRDSNFVRSTFKNTKIISTEVTGANFFESEFIESELRNWFAQDAYLGGVKFDKTLFEDIRFDKIEAPNLQIKCSIFHRGGFAGGGTSSFAGANIKNSDLSEINLDGARFKSVWTAKNGDQKVLTSKFENVDFSKTNFTGADFTDAVFNNVSFKEANLRGANFTNAKFRNVDFSGAVLGAGAADGGWKETPTNFKRTALRCEQLVSAKNWETAETDLDIDECRNAKKATEIDFERPSCIPEKYYDSKVEP